MLASPPSSDDDGIRFGRTRIVPTARPLLTLSADGIVAPANRRGVMGVGVAGTVRIKGGADIERQLMANAPLTMGTAVTTSAGDLERSGVRVVIHAVVSDALGSLPRENYVRKATAACLQEASNARVKTLAMPLLGVGGSSPGLGTERAALVMIEEIVSHLRRFTSRLDCIVLMCSDDREAAFLLRALHEARRQWWGLRV